MNKRHYEHTLPNIRGSLSNTYLSAMVYYKNSNPFLLLSVSERNDITRFLHQYHSFPLELELNLENIIPYLDKVFNKVSSNLACYIEDLRQNKLLEEY